MPVVMHSHESPDTAAAHSRATTTGHPQHYVMCSNLGPPGRAFLAVVARSILKYERGQLQAGAFSAHDTRLQGMIRRGSMGLPSWCGLSRVVGRSRGGVCWNPHKESVKPTHPLVSIVDDDESVSQSLPDLLTELGFSAQAFSSAEEFLASHHVNRTACLLLDVALPGMSGPDLLRELRFRGLEIPIIFITAQTGETLQQRLLEQGAVACLFKPFGESALLKALKSALQTS